MNAILCWMAKPTTQVYSGLACAVVGKLMRQRILTSIGMALQARGLQVALETGDGSLQVACEIRDLANQKLANRELGSEEREEWKTIAVEMQSKVGGDQVLRVWRTAALFGAAYNII
jgi:hypothetical protein